MDQATQKSSLLAAVVVCLGFLNFFGAAILMRSALTDTPATPPMLILAAVIAVIWSGLVALALTLIPSRLIRSLIIVGSGIAVVTAGFGRLGAIGGALLLMLLLALAQQAYQRDAGNRIIFRTRDIFTLGTRYVIIGIILAAAGLALPVVETTISRDGLRVQRDQVAIVVQPIEPLISQLAPGLTADSDVRDLIPSPDRPPEPVTLVDVVTDSINRTLINLTQQRPFLVSGILIILAFLTLRAFVPLISWIVVAGIAGMVWTARRFNLVQINTVPATAERLTL